MTNSVNSIPSVTTECHHDDVGGKLWSPPFSVFTSIGCWPVSARIAWLTAAISTDSERFCSSWLTGLSRPLLGSVEWVLVAVVVSSSSMPDIGMVWPLLLSLLWFGGEFIRICSCAVVIGTAVMSQKARDGRPRLRKGTCEMSKPSAREEQRKGVNMLIFT